MAVVECIKHPDYMKNQRNGNPSGTDRRQIYSVYVIPREHHIRLRYLFFNKQTGYGNLDSHYVPFEEHYYSFIDAKKVEENMAN